MLHRRRFSRGSGIRTLGSLSLALFSLSSAVLWAASCGRPHSLGVSGGAGGSGGGGGASASDGASSSVSASSSPSGAGVGGMDPGPSGPTTLTIVNGINDFDAIRICFLPYPDGDPSMKPWPSAAEGLPFARGLAIDPIEATVPPGKDIRPVVFAGDLPQIADKTCEEALALAASNGAGGGGAGGGGGGAGGGGGGDAGASPPPLLAAPLAVLPALVFDSHKSILLTPMGCLAPGHTGPKAPLACGLGYSSSAPTVSLLAVGMSRKTDASHLSLQVVNASPALQPSDVRIRSGFDSLKEWDVAPELALGTIGPTPPFAMFTAKDLGPLDKATVKTYVSGQAFQTSSTPFMETLEHGTVPKDKVVNGAGLVLVGVGAYPGIEAGPFWHKLTFTLIKANP